LNKYYFIIKEAYSVARQFNLIPPTCEQAEYHLFQREKVEVLLPDVFQKIGFAKKIFLIKKILKEIF
jgi:hypothetical protein